MSDTAQSPVPALAARGDSAEGPPQLEVESTATRVSFFEDRAEVLRRTRFSVEPGVNRVRVRGVSTMIDDPSLLANVRGGGARVLAARVQRQVRQLPVGDSTELVASEADQRSARARRITAERTVEARNNHELRVTALLQSWLDALARVPRAASQGLAEWRSAHDELHHAQLQAIEELAAAQRELVAAQLDEKRADQRYQQARRLRPRHEAVIELQLEAQAASELQLELTYRVPCALWRPEHLCRLVTGEGGAQLQITTYAVAWQRTGEDWSLVDCRFSTARPAQSAVAPLLSEDPLRLRKRSESERRNVFIEAREQSIVTAGAARGERVVEEMPGVDDGGEPLSYESSRPHDLPSSGQPVRVEVGHITLPCSVERVALPERSIAAHLRASATLTGPRPLLAGPVAVLRGGELCGRGRIGFIGRGEPFEIGLGTDDGLRVRRKVDEQRETATLTGAQRIFRTVRLYVSNLSGTAKRLVVTERVPISEIADVEVTLTQTSGMRYDPKDGFAHFDLELLPRATRELSFSYRMEAAARVILPPL
ncbi:MAG: DUF4139 domain-containing protein [Polyangia bacterium]